jgi:hypothetical protein
MILRTSGRRLLLLVALGAIVHAPFLSGGFLTDDFVHVEVLQERTLSGVLTSPDAFGYYRPVPQASMLFELLAGGPNPAAMRLTNLLLHAAVICAAFLLAHLMLGSARGANLGTLAFVLTAKAHSTAVLWISARPDLLMTLFTLLAVIAWIRFARVGGGRWLGAAWVCYVLALLCKETAVLLPLLLLITPPGSARLSPRRLTAVALMVFSAATILVVRAYAGALMPVSSAEHYDLLAPIGRWLGNAWNYFPRALPSSIALLVLVGVPAFFQAPMTFPARRRACKSSSTGSRS